MAKERYEKQVELLLMILPEIAREKELAIHGGTAINLFIRNMPRLSVDVDITYIPVENRNDTLMHIASSLNRVQGRIRKIIPRL